MNPNFRNFALWVVIFLLVLALVTLFQSPSQRVSTNEIPYSQLINESEAGRITNVVVAGQEKILADEQGKSLYTFDKDQPGKSDCTGICAAIWPPLVAAQGAKASGQWSLVRRNDGSMQWAYRGSPLYTYRLDIRPGDASGDGAEGVWHVARP